MTPAAALSLLERAEREHKRALWRLAARALGEIVAAQAAQTPQEPHNPAGGVMRQPEAKRPQAAAVSPGRPSLIEFLAERGLKDDGGELRGRDFDKWHRNFPFRRRLVREGGLPLERAAELAFDSGFFPDCIASEQVTVERLLDAMERELLADYPRLQRPAEDSEYWEHLEPFEREESVA